MNRPYLRAYMAGVSFPTFFLMLGFTAFMIAQRHYHIPVIIERVIVFPLAFIPNLWGFWNMVHLRVTQSHARWPIGAHGAVVPLVLVPLAYVVARESGVGYFTPAVLAASWPGLVVMYYLVWKYIVGFLNETLGVA
ncbi:MAG: hypothetical protein LAP85_16225 [Acidobacteriia bacterium]|nr:hypothetical protein [Terriglobia bacterium]